MPVPRAVVDTDTLNLRAGPDTAHPIIDTLRQGTRLDVVARTPDSQWLQVIVAGSTRGWVSRGLVTLNTPLQSIPIASTIPTPPKPTPTFTPVTASPTSRPASYARPKLKSPPHEFSTGWPDEVILRWGWPDSSRCDPLGPDEYFDVRVWTGGQPHSGIAWTRQCEYSLKNHLISEPAQTFHWAIAVIRGRNGQWQADLSPESGAWSINWRPPD